MSFFPKKVRTAVSSCLQVAVGVILFKYRSSSANKLPKASMREQQSVGVVVNGLTAFNGYDFSGIFSSPSLLCTATSCTSRLRHAIPAPDLGRSCSGNV